MPPDFSALLVVAGIIPLVILAQYRLYPAIRGRDSVEWVYCIPFVGFSGLMVGVAIGVYAEPFSAVISNRGSQALVFVILVELATVFLVTQEIEAAEQRESDNEDKEETNA